MVIETCPSLLVEDCPTLTQPVFKCKFKLTIPFHRLPLLVQVQVIRKLNPKDWINLAMTSKRNEKVVKLARIKTELPWVRICQDASIRLLSLKLDLFFDESFRKTKQWEIMTKDDIKSWLNKPSSSVIENAAKICQKIQKIFVFPNFLGISFCTDIEEKATIRELLSNPVMKYWIDLSITGKTISSEDVKTIMDRAKSFRYFECKVEEMPLDFKHENAFKFASQDYHDARWVRVRDLYELRNCGNVTLLRNNFTQIQIESFVYYWVHSEVDMFEWMKIGTKNEMIFESLMNRYLGLRWSMQSSNVLFMLSKTASTSRKKTMLSINCFRYGIILSAWAEDEKYQANENEELNKQFRNCREILTKLQEKKDLVDLRKVASGEEKIELTRKIRHVIAKLRKLKVVFRGGKAWLNS